MGTENNNPQAVVESLAAWANEKDVGMAEWKRRAGIVDAVAELMEAASAGGVMRSHGDDKECLWFGPEKAARLRAALARMEPQS